MNKLRESRRAKIRKTIKGVEDKPRLVIFCSNKYFYGQVVDDVRGTTVASVNKSTDPQKAGEELAEKILKLKIKSVVFDRAGYRYHGNVKKFAESVRAKGINF